MAKILQEEDKATEDDGPTPGNRGRLSRANKGSSRHWSLNDLTRGAAVPVGAAGGGNGSGGQMKRSNADWPWC